jgi:hypothetical protein
MIKNLPPHLNEYGCIKIGVKGAHTTSASGKEFRLPQKLDHFLLTTTEKNEAGDYIVDTALMDRIKESGTGIVNDNGNLVGIPVRLLYDDIESNFPTRYACYAGNKLSCYGDGEVSNKRIDDYKKDHPCPCNRLDPDYDGDQKCKANGRLTCMIDEAGFFGQAHVFRTTSINSVKGIWGGMELIKVATKGRLAGIPLMLTLSAKHTSNGAVYVVSICFNGTMEALRDSVHELAVKEKVYLLETHNQHLITEPGSEDEQDFIEEFYPDTLSQEVETKVKPIETGGVDHDENSENTDTTRVADENENCNAEWTRGDEHAEKQGDVKTEDQDHKSNPNPKSSQINIDARLINKSGTYARLYNRFLVAANNDDYDNALKLANRMTKDYLELFFTRERPDVKLKPKLKKPELIEIIKNLLDGPAPMLHQAQPVYHDEKDYPDTEEHPFLVEIQAMEERDDIVKAMVEFFKPIPVNMTLDRDGLIAWAEQRIGDGEQSDEDEQDGQEQNQPFTDPTNPGNTKSDPKEDDDLVGAINKLAYDEESGPVQEEQLITIVKLKVKAEKAGLLQQNDFFNIVNEFTDAAGKNMDSATKFSFDQGFTLIERLNNMLPEADRIANIPF